MKKLYTFCFASLFLTMTAKPQYAPVLGDTTEWCVAYDFVAVLQEPDPQRWVWDDQHFVAAGDSVVGLDTFKIVRNYTGVIAGLMREDTITGKVYFKGMQSTAQKIYDFSLGMGDTIHLSFLPGCYYFHTGVYTVDSVATLQTQVGPRKFLRLTSPANTTQNSVGFIPRLEWVEGIGSLYDPRYVDDEAIYGYPMIVPASCDAQQTGQMLIRKLCDGVTEYSRPCFFSYMPYNSPDSCIIDYQGSVNDLNAGYQPLFVYPNPSNGTVTLDLDKFFSTENNVRVFAMDITGKKSEITSLVRNNRNEIIIPSQTLCAGIHIITVEGEKLSGMARVIITH